MLLAIWFSSEEDVGVQVNLIARPFEQESKRLVKNRFYKRIELAVFKDEQEEETMRKVKLAPRILDTWAGYGSDMHEEVTVLAAPGPFRDFYAEEVKREWWLLKTSEAAELVEIAYSGELQRPTSSPRRSAGLFHLFIRINAPFMVIYDGSQIHQMSARQHVST